MPAFFTHYAFGVQNYKSMDEGKLKQLIKEYHASYSLGTSGPDIFFYYFPHLMLREKKPASVMHETHAKLFFEHMLKRAELFSGEKKRIAYAYIAGFIGHYELDRHCHPYVYALTQTEDGHEESGRHFALEAAMDVYCSCHYLHRLPTELEQRKIIGISKSEQKVICRLLADAYNATYHLPKQNMFTMKRTLWFMNMVIFLLEDKKGMKETVWTKLEKLIFGHAVTAPLFINNNCYEYQVEDWYEFHEFWKNGLREYQKVMPFLETYVMEKGDKKASRTELLKQIGNYSYHHGKML